MSGDEKLTKLIDDLVNQKTFSLDGLKAVEELRKRACDLERTLENAHGRIISMEGVLTETSTELAILRGRENEIVKKDAAIKARESAIFELEKGKAVADAKSEVWSGIFHTIFKNTVVRENVTRSLPVTNQYGTIDYKTENSIHLKEME